MVTFGFTEGTAIAFAVVCFTLRGKGYVEGTHNDYYNKVTTDGSHIHFD
ncbi:MAG: hypothetical protein IIA19_00485 [Thaumarchaeota archaeon]|nr:hypothetical protein [Nitrososphaerota archaeon]